MGLIGRWAGLAVLAWLVVAMAGFDGDARPADDPRPPNILFIMVDDLGSGDLGCTGGTLIHTPRLDELASAGMRFTQAYAGACVCAPARATLMTGLHAGHTSVRGNTGGIPLPAGTITVASLLKDAGYATGGFGKWGLGEVGTEGVPERFGFDTFVGNYHQIHAHYFYTPYLWHNSVRLELPGNVDAYQSIKGPGPVSVTDPNSGRARQYTHDVVVERTRQFIRDHRDGPFFCYAAWNPPHGRYEIPDDDPAWAMYADRHEWPMKARVAAAMTSMVDRQVGELLDLLDELDIADDTIVFFCSDNGGEPALLKTLRSNGELRGGKRDLYEGGLRVPLIVAWPGRIEPGATSDLPTYFPDVLPTLVDLAGGSMPATTDGVSIVPTLLGPEASGRRQVEHPYLYWEYTPYQWGNARYRPGGPMQAVRWGDWKAVRVSDDRAIELYDLAADPGERADVAGAYPDVVRMIDGVLRSAHVAAPQQVEPERINGRPYR